MLHFENVAESQLVNFSCQLQKSSTGIKMSEGFLISYYHTQSYIDDTSLGVFKMAIFIKI